MLRQGGNALKLNCLAGAERIRIEKDLGLGETVVPAAFLLVQKNPPEAEAENQPGQEGGKEAQGGLTPVDGVSVRRQDFDFPGPHAESLAAMRPEPAEKQEADADQIGGIKILVWPESIAGVERQYRGGGRKQYRAKQEQIVNDGRQTAKEAGRRICTRNTGVFSRSPQLFKRRHFLAEIHAAGGKDAKHDH